MFSLSCNFVKSRWKKRWLKSLTVGDKIKIIDEVKKGVKRKKYIASEFGILVNTLSTTLKDKDTILKSIEEAPCLARRKRIKASSFQKLSMLWRNRWSE